MTPTMIPILISVPPAQILERAVGYQSNRDAHYLALWWEPAGDEAMVSDGFVTFTGHWPGYLAYVHHAAVYPFVASYNLGSSDNQAEYRLVIDLQERKAYVAKSRDAEKVLAGQWSQETLQTEPISLSAEDIEVLLQGFEEQNLPLPTIDELRNQIEEDRKAVETLTRWLDNRMK